MARVTTNQIQGPAITNSGHVIVFYEQRSAILARADIDPDVLQLSKIQSGLFNAKLTLNVGGNPVDVHRAWISVDVKFYGTSFRFIDTQFEAFDPKVNHDQAEELLAGPANTAEPVVLAMDSNSKADLPRNATSPTYYDLLQRGFTDAWTQAEGDSPGLTCCLESSMPNHRSTVIKRIDLILLRGDLKADSAQVLGGEVSDKTSGLWPSNHLAVVARLETE